MKFWKIHGLGNDYIVIDNRDEKISNAEAAELALKLCKRRFSVGADGILFVSNSAVADVKMRIFNADGSEAEMCGNGIRCFAKYCYENDITQKSEVTKGNTFTNEHVGDSFRRGPRGFVLCLAGPETTLGSAGKRMNAGTGALMEKRVARAARTFERPYLRMPSVWIKSR